MHTLPPHLTIILERSHGTCPRDPGRMSSVTKDPVIRGSINWRAWKRLGNFPMTGVSPTSVRPPSSERLCIALISVIGDARGPRRFLNDVVYPHSPEKPRTSISINHHQSRWTPREFKFLQSEGVFSLMERAVSEGLLRCYLHNVHFFLPILDLSTFWKQYEEVHQSDFSSVMLYWSVMLAATNVSSQKHERWLMVPVRGRHDHRCHWLCFPQGHEGGYICSSKGELACLSLS